MERVRPIFVVGSPRSGTTLLSVMMHAHPRLALPPETRFLLPIYRSRARFGDLSVARNRRRLARRMTQERTRFADLGLDQDAVRAEIEAHGTTIGTAAGIVWRAFARDRGKPRWGEKRPAYWYNMDAVLRLFPTAQIVHVVRDGRACVASLQNTPWYRGGSTRAAVAWSLCERELTRVGRTLPADSYHHLRYEDLVREPRATLESLCGFLAEPFDDAMLDHAGAADDIVPARKTWHERTRGAVDVARIDAWRETLTGRQLGLLDRVLATDLERAGYEVSGVGPRPAASDLARFLAGRRYRATQLQLTRARDARQYRRDGVDVADLG